MGIRKLYIWIMAIMAVIVCACTDSNVNLPEEPNVPEGYMRITFKANVPDMNVVESRAVDPDGVDVSNMTLFCFNRYGLFISTTQATLTPDSEEPSTSGIFDATVPSDTKIIHFIANQNPALYSELDFRNKTEQEVIAAMEGASGMIIYWARFESSGTADIKEQLNTKYNPDGEIKLIRNQAKVTTAVVANGTSWTTQSFVITGFVTTNIHAFGTVAPYHLDNGFPTESLDNGIYTWDDALGDDFVTLPENTAMMSGIEDVNTKEEDYIFEHENTVDNPVNVIIKGHYEGETEADDKYYRVMLANDGEMLKVRRNHWYKVNINGPLAYGRTTFAEALKAPASNNVWVSVESWVDEISSDDFKLSVEKTGVILEESYAGTTYNLKYTLLDIDNTDNTTVPTTGADVSWLDGNNVALNAITNTYNTSTGEGILTITLNELADGNEIQSGTILVECGALRRTIEVVVLKQQKLTPCWVGTQVYAETTESYVTLMFTVPETTPDIMFPFKVLIEVNALDIRSSTGISLPVVRKGESDWYGVVHNTTTGGYKYVYEVTEPGVQRIYFHNILTVGENESRTETLWLDAKFFGTVEKSYVLTSHKRAINLMGFQNFSVFGESSSDKEKVYYRLVPQKINANVQIDMELTSNGTAINAGVNDEFLLYSQNLDAYTDEELGDRGITKICNFYQVDENYWQSSTNGRVVMFKPVNSTATNTGNYSVFMKTNRSVSAEVVRIASNAAGQNSALPGNTTNAYAGNSYRSVVFELANYRPFRFAAQVNGVGNFKDNSVTDDEEDVDEIELTYVPEQQVNISLDVTSFEGTDGKSVDPFGTEFEIYIDAPMLKIDESRLAECKLNGGKLYVDPVVEGRFIYKVDSSRETERNYGTDNVKNADSKATSQSGERKTLPFLTKYIVSSGEIKISSNKDKVVYFDKTFEVSNTPIEGSITYGGTNVPKDAFVAFALVRNGARIGSMAITADGKYSLKLRKEYSFNWYNGEIEVSYIYNNSGTKIVYTATIPNLASLYANPNIALTTQPSTGG